MNDDISVRLREATGETTWQAWKTEADVKGKAIVEEVQASLKEITHRIMAKYVGTTHGAFCIPKPE